MPPSSDNHDCWPVIRTSVALEQDRTDAIDDVGRVVAFSVDRSVVDRYHQANVRHDVLDDVSFVLQGCDDGTQGVLGRGFRHNAVMAVIVITIRGE